MNDSAYGKYNIQSGNTGIYTLNEVAEKYAVPVSELTRALKVSAFQSRERIGRLKRKYGFEMEELKRAILRLSDDIVR